MLEEGLKPGSVNRYLATLQAILNKSQKQWKALATVPDIELIPLDDGRRRWLDDAEEKRLLEACASQPHLHDLVVFLMDTGARLSEATELTWKHVDLERQPRGLVRFYKTKSKKPRTVPLTARVQAMLQHLHDQRPEDQDRVFLIRVNPAGRWKTEQKAVPFRRPGGAWKSAVEKAKRGGLRLHDLRHTFASRLVMRRVPMTR